MGKYAKRIGDRRVWGMILPVIWVIVCGGGVALAEPVQWSDGRIVDLTSDQVVRIKRQPGIHYFEYRPDRIVKSRIDQWDIIELPPSLGGGFLLGRTAQMEDALASVAADAPAGPLGTDPVTEPAGRPFPSTDTIAAIDPQAPWQWQWWVHTGYRQDELDWNIAGPGFSGDTVNVLSELEWRDVQLWQVNVGIHTLILDRIRLQGDLAYGYAFDGEVTDSDYEGDDRTLLWSRSESSAEGSETTDFSIGAGYRFTFLSRRIGVTPLFGYSVHHQFLKLRDGVQKFSDESLVPPFIDLPEPGQSLEEFAGEPLKSSYDARWQGFWIGLDSSFTLLAADRFSPRHEFFLGFEYHFDADYDAEATWNLRSDLQQPKSFEHEARGYGLVFDGRYSYFFNPTWSLSLTGRYQKWEAEEGTDRIFFADGSIATTPLNEVNWESMAVMIGVDCRF